MSINDINNYNRIVISTGNVLNVNKKAGQKTPEELFDCIKATLNEPDVRGEYEIYRKCDDLNEKLMEHKREDIKIGAKVFLNNDNEENLRDAIENLFDKLNGCCLDNLILAYHPKNSELLEYHQENGTGDPIPSSPITTMWNGTPPITIPVQSSQSPIISGSATSPEIRESVLEWGGGNVNAVNDLKRLWAVLEEYVIEKKKICQLGISDLDTISLIDLHKNVKVKPTIAQINLSTCCVVPPPLQEFCNKNDIQLLTHSDPEEILTKSSLKQLGLSHFNTSWTTRFQIHIKCRGVLAAKGFVIGLHQE